ncbi:MAG: hypothetical protein V7636_2714, partial [Actinomycetota bacterium]
IVREHAALLVDDIGERMGLLSMRKHVSWYFHDVTVGGDARRALQSTSTLVELEHVLDDVAATGQLPDHAPRPRGPSAGPRRVVLPDGWLDRAADPTPPDEDVSDAVGG